MSELTPPDTAAVSERTCKRGLAHNLEENGGERHQFVIGEYPLHLGDMAYGYRRQCYTTFIPRFAPLVNTHLEFSATSSSAYAGDPTRRCPAGPQPVCLRLGHTDFDKGSHV